MGKHAKLDFERAIRILNNLLSEKQPESFSSSWILKNAPGCHGFIRRSVRNEVGRIDWDRVTRALERGFQRRWAPRRRKVPVQYRDVAEVNAILGTHRPKLYIFIAATSAADRHLRDVISINLVRLAQAGNLSAKRKVVQLVGYSVQDWLEHHAFLSRWRGYESKVTRQLEACIRRYRYTGTFLGYVFRTLECAGRGLRPLRAYSLDEPIFNGAKFRIDAIGRTPLLEWPQSSCTPTSDAGHSRIYGSNQ